MINNLNINSTFLLIIIKIFLPRIHFNNFYKFLYLYKEVYIKNNKTESYLKKMGNQCTGKNKHALDQDAIGTERKKKKA